MLNQAGNEKNADGHKFTKREKNYYTTILKINKSYITILRKKLFCKHIYVICKIKMGIF